MAVMLLTTAKRQAIHYLLRLFLAFSLLGRSAKIDAPKTGEKGGVEIHSLHAPSPLFFIDPLLFIQNFI